MYSNVPPKGKVGSEGYNYQQPPHGGYQPPHGGYQQPQSGYQPPHSGYQPPHGGYQPPHGEYQPPYGGYQPPQDDEEEFDASKGDPQQQYDNSYKDNYYKDNSNKDDYYKDNYYKDNSYKDNAYKDNYYKDNNYQDNYYKDNSYKDNAYKDNYYKDNNYQDNYYKDNSYKDNSYKEPPKMDNPQSKFEQDFEKNFNVPAKKVPKPGYMYGPHGEYGYGGTNVYHTKKTTQQVIKNTEYRVNEFVPVDIDTNNMKDANNKYLPNSTKNLVKKSDDDLMNTFLNTYG